jgi:hypothetical protein
MVRLVREARPGRLDERWCPVRSAQKKADLVSVGQVADGPVRQAEMGGRTERAPAGRTERAPAGRKQLGTVRRWPEGGVRRWPEGELRSRGVIRTYRRLLSGGDV